MKLLHSADWHLDAPMLRHGKEAGEELKKELLKIPEKIARLCRNEKCDLMLLAGDLFDGPYSHDSFEAVRNALESVRIPVVISPGNHDFCGPDSPYIRENWPENVHIFTKPQLQSFAIEALDCRIYGAGYTSMDCPGLLENFLASGQERWHIGILHGEISALSPYCPITKDQIRESGLDYLALGHIHKGSSFRIGDTFCAWPGCPMGKGYDETGPKGVILAQLEDGIRGRFVPLDTPVFYDEETEAGEDPAEAVAALVPAMESRDFYRVTLTGYSAGVDISALQRRFSYLPHLTVLDHTRPEMDLWQAVGEDTLEGIYFGLLQHASESESPVLSRRAKLAARISRQILDGQEVKLP